MGQFPRFLRVSPIPKARPFWHATCPTTSWWSWSRPFFGKGNEQWRVLSDLFFGIFFHPERKVVKQWSPGFLEGGSWNSGIMGIEYEERYVFFFGYPEPDPWISSKIAGGSRETCLKPWKSDDFVSPIEKNEGWNIDLYGSTGDVGYVGCGSISCTLRETWRHWPLAFHHLGTGSFPACHVWWQLVDLVEGPIHRVC